MKKPVLVEGIEKQTAALRYKAIGLLARREQSRHELQRKLHIKAVENDWRVDLETLLDDLCRLGLQSDQRFAEVLVRSKANSGYGPSRLYQWGLQYGLDRELVHQQLLEQSFDWFEKALQQKRKHFGHALATDLKDRAKQAKYLYQRGFAQEQIYYALDAHPDEHL
ncbi:MAG: regulatory protein RecX [Oceanospirillaceae bacterium]|nr:regulatory protein RecX [Oceanospirillaceae bacterium]